MLPYLTKPLIEFYLDYCVLNGVTDILIVREIFDHEAEAFISSGSRWGLNITRAFSKPNETIEDVTRKNIDFLSDDTIIFNGYFLPVYNKNSDLKFSELEQKNLKYLKVYPENSSAKLLSCQECEMPTITDYHSLNMRLLNENSEDLIMNGYGVQKGVFMGMNTVVMNRSSIRTPFMLGDNSHVGVDAQIGESAIIGNSCVIDKRTVIKKSIIFNKTYVGADLEICNKIIFGGKIIDPITMVYVNFEDDFFMTQLIEGAGKRFFRMCFDVPFALVMWLMMLPFFILYVLIGKVPERKILHLPKFFSNMTLSVPSYTQKEKKRTIDAWFFKLCLDKFVPLYYVITGRLPLIGDTMYDHKDIEALKRYKEYIPGAFSYADSVGADKNDILVNDLYYKYNKSLKSDLQVLLRTLTTRLFK